jgi:hypothetical protein
MSGKPSAAFGIERIVIVLSDPQLDGNSED